MNTVLVWVLVYGTYVNGGSLVNVVGDYATVQDCEAVGRAMTSFPDAKARAFQCVQVRKVK